MSREPGPGRAAKSPRYSGTGLAGCVESCHRLTFQSAALPSLSIACERCPGQPVSETARRLDGTSVPFNFFKTRIEKRGHSPLRHTQAPRGSIFNIVVGSPIVYNVWAILHDDQFTAPNIVRTFTSVSPYTSRGHEQDSILRVASQDSLHQRQNVSMRTRLEDDIESLLLAPLLKDMYCKSQLVKNILTKMSPEPPHVPKQLPAPLHSQIRQGYAEGGRYWLCYYVIGYSLCARFLSGFSELFRNSDTLRILSYPQIAVSWMGHSKTSTDMARPVRRMIGSSSESWQPCMSCVCRLSACD